MCLGNEFYEMEENFMNELRKQTDVVNAQLARYGVKFGIYKNNEFKEQLFPFDPIPRMIGKDEFEYLNRGLIQRVKALNCFLKDNLFRLCHCKGWSGARGIYLCLIWIFARM